MSAVARFFFVLSGVIALALGVWVGVDLIALGGSMQSWPWAVLLWLGTGGPLIAAGLLIAAFRARRSSMEMPAHLPDGKRR